MLSKLSNCHYISSSFDKSSNGSVDKGQMNIKWTWRQTLNETRRYLGLEFMGRSTAEDVLQTSLASDINQSKILQVASNVPNVNLLFCKSTFEIKMNEMYGYQMDPD